MTTDRPQFTPFDTDRASEFLQQSGEVAVLVDFKLRPGAFYLLTGADWSPLPLLFCSRTDFAAVLAALKGTELTIAIEAERLVRREYTPDA